MLQKRCFCLQSWVIAAWLCSIFCFFPSTGMASHHVTKKTTHHLTHKTIQKKKPDTSQQQQQTDVINENLSLQSGLQTLVNREAKNARVGVVVEALDPNKVLFQYNADNLFMPASVNKLFVSVAALNFLKSDYHFQTALKNTGAVNNGILNGDLYVQFNGDPTLTNKDLTGLLDEIKNSGVKQINGHVYLDNTAYGASSYAPGWLLHDLIFGYAAPLNAVIINENRFSITLSPLRPGRPAIAGSTLPNGVIKIDNKTTTNSRKSNCPLSFYSDNDNTYHVSGCVAAQPNKQYYALALRDPVVYAKVLIENYLSQNQITFQGPIDIQQAPNTSSTLAVHLSPPLNAIIKTLLKESNNLYTNSILKQIGAVYYQSQGTWENGLNAVKQILSTPAAIDFNQSRLFDGSGLSRYDSVSPHQLAQLLKYAYGQTQIKPDLWDALPIAGHDGTLRGRLILPMKNQFVHAKTGTMKGVSALAGYIETLHNGLLVFVIITNGPEDDHRAYKNFEDRICKFLLFSKKSD